MAMPDSLFLTLLDYAGRWERRPTLVMKMPHQKDRPRPNFWADHQLHIQVFTASGVFVTKSTEATERVHKRIPCRIFQYSLAATRTPHLVEQFVRNP